MASIDLRTAAQQALEALESCDSAHPSDGGKQWYDDKLVEPAITALRAALAEPVQEPVAWTPVAEALPKSGVKVLACYRNRLGNLRRIRAQWVAAKTEEVCGDADDWGEYDEEAECYWTPQGWYECIDNWGDYSSVAVCEGEVTHWMPLPPAPDTVSPQRPAEPEGGGNLPPPLSAEPVLEPDYWQEEARRYAGNADYWRKRYEALAQPAPEPVTRKPLDDLAIADIYTTWDATPGVSMADFARAIEAAHGIKEEA